MTKLPVLSAREDIQKLKKSGFVFDRHAKGSHEIYYDSTTHRRTVVPNHPRDIPKGTLKAIIKEAGLTVEEFCGV